MKCNYIVKIFDQSYNSPLSIIILDDIIHIPLLSKKNIHSIVNHIGCNKNVENIIVDIAIKKLLFKIEML